MFSFLKFLFILIIFSKPVFANEAIYKFVNKLYQPHEEIHINFENINCSVNLRVSIIETTGKLEIYNEFTKTWMKVPADWISFVKISPRLRLRIVSPNSPNVTLDIKFQNILTGEVFVVPSIQIWVSDFQSVYIDQLNKNIFDYDDKIHE